MKAIPQSLKPTQTKTKQARKINVGLDVFGNAIPEVKSALVEGTGKALRIVKRQDVIVKPPRKRNRPVGKKAHSTSRALVPVSPTLLGKLVPWWPPATGQKDATKTKAVTVTQVKPLEHPHADGIADRLEHAFKRLHHEFNEREQRLEDKMHALRQQQQSLLGTKRKTRLWLLPLALVGSAVMGYMMYVMTSMQGSMTAMSGNINTIASDTQSMSHNTQAMSQNMQAMNQNMYYINNNVAYMSGNVAQMNQKVGTLAQAAAPMGEAASTVSPFMKMFKSFMPF